MFRLVGKPLFVKNHSCYVLLQIAAEAVAKWHARRGGISRFLQQSVLIMYARNDCVKKTRSRSRLRRLTGAGLARITGSR